MPGHLLVQLALAPARVAKRHDPLLGPPPFGDRAEDVDRTRHREQAAVFAIDVERVLPAPVRRVKDKAPAGFDRAAVMNGAIGCFARLDVELPKQPSEGDSRALVANSDADRPIFVMDAHRDHRPLEPRVRHSGHCQQQLAGQETRLLSHTFDNATAGPRGQDLRR